ncbi:MBL fold metallo-hydrolase [Cetobacterium sp.]|uniref:MBL fold metallo-hydrolase n=1 Tax=Cetobacterium sp. TaxID=2071632 RepID=UPI003F415E85
MYFYGISGSNKIGGSSYFIKMGDRKFLLDMGLDPNLPGSYPKYENLYRKKLLTSMGDLDGVIISHAHLDHIGSLPYMLKEGKKVPILTSNATKILGKTLLLSAPKESDEYIEIFKKDEIESIFSLINPTEGVIEKDYQINFYDSGHILGSKMTEIVTKDERVLYTGDFSLKNMITAKKIPLASIQSPDILLCEGTNLTKNLNSYINERLGFIRYANKVVANGVLLIPAFALGRTQEVVCLLKNAMKSQLLKRVPIYVDGLSIEISQLYNQLGINVLDEDVKIASKRFYETMDNSPKIIVCSSGMLLQNSKSYLYAQKVLKNENNSVTFVGYQDKKTPGFKLLYQKKFNFKANINRFSFSAHGDENEIFQLIDRLKPKKVVFLHRNLKEDEERELEKRLVKIFGKNIKFYFPKDGEELNL